MDIQKADVIFTMCCWVTGHFNYGGFFVCLFVFVFFCFHFSMQTKYSFVLQNKLSQGKLQILLLCVHETEGSVAVKQVHNTHGRMWSTGLWIFTQIAEFYHTSFGSVFGKIGTPHPHPPPPASPTPSPKLPTIYRAIRLRSHLVTVHCLSILHRHPQHSFPSVCVCGPLLSLTRLISLSDKSKGASRMGRATTSQSLSWG